ncbi:MAG: hypothetical protein GX417_06665 [Clostridiales bacterium]|nr:hypothetical protein [Clostridiales bacterium]
MQPTTNQQRFLRATAILTAVYLCAVFFALPLVFSNFYFNITETKQTFFMVASGAFVLLLLFARIAFLPDYGVGARRVPPHPAALALCGLFVVSVVGALLSRYPDDVFWGQNNRYQGLLTLFAYALVVLVLSRRKVDLRWPERALALGAALVGLLGLLNHFGADPLGFTENLRKSDQGRFLSTIGNADFYGSYLVMAFPATLGVFLHAKTLRGGVLSGLALVCVSFGALVAGSDSAALGLLAGAVVFPLALFTDARAMRRLPLGWGIFFLCAFVFGLLSRRLPSATYLSYFTTLVSRPAVALPLAAVMLLLWRLPSRRPERLPNRKRAYGISLAAALALGLLALVLLNTALKNLPLGGLDRYLRFSESWGTDRGKIWVFVSRFYASLPTAQKLFGAGSGALFHADALRPLFSDASLDTAHNEYLQYLVTNGALGLLCYLAALGFALRSGFSRCAAQPASRGLTVAVAAYAAQALVNIAQPASTPLFFVLLGVLVSRVEPPARPPDETTLP